MKQSKVNVMVLPDTNRPKKDQRVALKLRITYKGKRRYYSTGYDASKEEWIMVNSYEAKARLRRIKNAITEIEISAQKCCDDIIPFSFKRFEYVFFDQKIIFASLQSAYGSYIMQLKNNEQYSSALTYQTALNIFEKFQPGLNIDDINIEFLEKFLRLLESCRRRLDKLVARAPRCLRQQKIT